MDGLIEENKRLREKSVRGEDDKGMEGIAKGREEEKERVIKQ
jgi:hypothetical protein